MILSVLLFAMALQQQPPVPQPFPRPTSPPVRPPQPRPTPVAPVTDPSPAVTDAPRTPAPPTPPLAGEPDEATLGVPVYPGAQFIGAYDAGSGQTLYLYGTSVPFLDLVTYYRTVLKGRGELIFEAPATHQFDIGRFREQTMAFPPSITIKDYESAVSRGYPNPVPGGVPDHFRTVIQIVPVPGNDRR